MAARKRIELLNGNTPGERVAAAMKRVERAETKVGTRRGLALLESFRQVERDEWSALVQCKTVLREDGIQLIRGAASTQRADVERLFAIAQAHAIVLTRHADGAKVGIVEHRQACSHPDALSSVVGCIRDSPTKKRRHSAA